MYTKAELMMNANSMISALALCLAVTSCRTAVSLSTDGSLTDHSIVLISAAPGGMKGSRHAPVQSRAYYGREGCKGKVSFKVARSQAHDVCIATLVPDFRVEGIEYTQRFIPAQTKQLIFSSQGISALARAKKVKRKKR